MISTPKHWLPNFQQTGAPLCPPEMASWGALRPEEGGVNLLQPELPVWPLPLASPPCPFVFRRGKLPAGTPFPTRPPVCPSPAGNPSPGAPANLPLALGPGQPLRNRKQRGSGTGQRPQPGLPVFPSPHPARTSSLAPAAPRGHLSGRRKGLSAGIGGTYQCGAGAGAGAAGRARLGRPRAGRCGQERRFAGSLPLLLPRPDWGALLRRPLPAPHAGRGAPPAPSGRPCLPHAAGLRRRA